MYAILLKNGEDRVKCKDCGGEGSLPIRGSLKVCKVCNGLGIVPVIEKAQRALRQFQQPTNYTIHHGHSVVLRYCGYDDVIHALQALWLSGIKARVVFPI
jgi:RecJ-like exonuclease